MDPNAMFSMQLDPCEPHLLVRFVALSPQEHLCAAINYWKLAHFGLDHHQKIRHPSGSSLRIVRAQQHTIGSVRIEMVLE